MANLHLIKPCHAQLIMEVQLPSTGNTPSGPGTDRRAFESLSTVMHNCRLLKTHLKIIFLIGAY